MGVPTYYYRPQRSCGQGNIFTPVCHSFCSQGGRGSASMHAGIPPREQIPPGADQPPRTRPTTPPRPGRPPRNRQTLPQSRHPPDQADPPPGPDRLPPPPGKADFSIRSTSGRYASYWNAFLFCKFFAENCMKMKEYGLQGMGGGVGTSPPSLPKGKIQNYGRMAFTLDLENISKSGV